jgi:di/tricarboxylate transporter
MVPLTPDVHGIAVLLLIVAALILFTRDRLPLESSALAVLIALIVGFELFPYEVNGVELGVSDFVSGFGHEALISICSLILIGKGLETTGALQPLARLVAGMMESRPRLALLLMLVAVAGASAFVNDTPIVVLMIPVLVGISVRSRLPLSVMLLPMGLATIIGGMTTSIGTSTNLLVTSLGKELQAADIAMFDFVLPAAIVGSVGLVFVWLAAPYILPRRHLLMEDESQRIFLAELLITSGSRAADKPLSEVLALVDTDMRIERIRRGENSELARLPSVVIRPGDRLLVRDNPENLMEIERQLGATFIGEEREQGGWDRLLAEVVVTRGSPLHLRSLGEADFVTGEDVVPIAVHRARYPGSVVRKEIEKLQLRIGDVLLVQGFGCAQGEQSADGTRWHHRVAPAGLCKAGTGRAGLGRIGIRYRSVADRNQCPDRRWADDCPQMPHMARRKSCHTCGRCHPDCCEPCPGQGSGGNRYGADPGERIRNGRTGFATGTDSESLLVGGGDTDKHSLK